MGRFCPSVNEGVKSSQGKIVPPVTFGPAEGLGPATSLYVLMKAKF